MQIAIIGGGINGLCCAWQLADRGHAVSLFERGRLLRATSRASSRLLHGGLRYLESGQVSLVREALRERERWLARAPHATRPLPLLLPAYRGAGRPRWRTGLGLALYRLLAGRSSLPGARWLGAAEVAALAPGLRRDRLRGAFRYWDAQMDDVALGRWVAAQGRQAGVAVHEHTPVRRLTRDGRVCLADGRALEFDRVVNVAGPWAERLLVDSGIRRVHTLDLVRGSHLLLRPACRHACLLEVPGAARVVFVLPWRRHTLLGTTEQRQDLDQPIACSAAERTYLLDIYNHYFTPALGGAEVLAAFAGLRPLLRSAADPTRASRDYALQRDGRLVSVFGGKWTTAMALAARVARLVQTP